MKGDASDAGAAAVALAARSLDVAPADVRWKAKRHWANSTVWRFDSGRQRVVVKAGRDWTPEVVRELHVDAVALLEALGTEGRVFAVPSLGFARTPPMQCSDFVEGEDGSVEMASWLRETSGEPPEPANSLVFRWGEALAAYHGASKARLNEQDRAAASDHLRRISRWLGRSGGRAAEALSQFDGGTARSFVDVGLHNVRSTPEGRTCLLDLPVERIVTPVFYDVAQALAWLDDAYRDAPMGSRSKLRKRFGPKFIDGYESRSALPMRSPSARHLTALYLTWCHFQWMRTAAKRRHFIDAPIRAAKGIVGLLRGPVGRSAFGEDGRQTSR